MAPLVDTTQEESLFSCKRDFCVFFFFFPLLFSISFVNIFVFLAHSILIVFCLCFSQWNGCCHWFPLKMSAVFFLFFFRFFFGLVSLLLFARSFVDWRLLTQNPLEWNGSQANDIEKVSSLFPSVSLLSLLLSFTVDDTEQISLFVYYFVYLLLC